MRLLAVLAGVGSLLSPALAGSGYKRPKRLSSSVSASGAPTRLNNAIQTYSEVWPMPQQMTTGSVASAPLSPMFSINCASTVCPDPLAAAFTRYMDVILFAGGAPNTGASNAITGLNVKVLNTADLALGVSENYTLTVPATGGPATITADNQWGALRGLETFSQLVVWQPQSINSTAETGNNYAVYNLPISVTDFPRFPWRGVLLDSSRHYLTVSSIMSTLDAMSYNKLNRLHWHVVGEETGGRRWDASCWCRFLATPDSCCYFYSACLLLPLQPIAYPPFPADDNSWPLVSETYPNFTVGAYTPQAIYTHADVSAIVQYAWERGISIIPEFDGPAHATAWGAGYPNLVINCPNGQSLLNPTDNGGVYDVIQGLMQEFVPLFQTDFIHFGGDEVENYICWEQSTEVQQWMQTKGFTTMFQVRNYFEMKLQQMAVNMGLSTMFWEEVYDGNFTLLPSTIVDVWLSDQELLQAVQAGHRVVESYGLYLDQQLPPGGTHYLWVDTWQNFYLHDPLYGANVTDAQAALVLGLSASQWGEQVDAVNIHSRMWPRASASAERMWSSSDVRDVDAAEARLEHMRCHMIQRGIGAGPIRPSNEHGFCPIPDMSKWNSMHSALQLQKRMEMRKQAAGSRRV